MKKNPAQFERCVKAVKKRGGAANAYAVCTAAGTRKKKKNPAVDSEYIAAAKASEEFHGTPAHEDFEFKTKIFEHTKLGDIGELVSLEIKSVNGGVVTLKGFKGTRLARSPKGAKDQLYIEGGDQSVDLKAFGIKNPHESEVLGKLKKITYYTVKHHLGKDGGEANYKHKFGDNPKLLSRIFGGNHLPTVIYDVLNKLLSISGGSYEILPEGIDN